MDTLTLERAAELYRIINMLSQKIREDRTDGHAYNMRGLCYEQMGKLEWAIEDMTQAIRYDGWIHQYTDRARCYLQAGKYVECIADCEAALEKKKRVCEHFDTPYAPFTPALIIRAEAEKLLQKEKQS